MPAVETVESGALWATIPSPLPEQPPIDPSLVTPGLLGLAAFLFLVIAVALLYRSMRNQLKKVDPELPEEPPREPQIPIIDSSGAPSTESASTQTTSTNGPSTDGPSADTTAGGDPPARA